MRLIIVLAAVFQAVITKNIDPLPRTLPMSTEVEIRDTGHSNRKFVFVLISNHIYDRTHRDVVAN